MWLVKKHSVKQKIRLYASLSHGRREFFPLRIRCSDVQANLGFDCFLGGSRGRALCQYCTLKQTARTERKMCDDKFKQFNCLSFFLLENTLIIRTEKIHKSRVRTMQEIKINLKILPNERTNCTLLFCSTIQPTSGCGK